MSLSLTSPPTQVLLLPAPKPRAHTPLPPVIYLPATTSKALISMTPIPAAPPARPPVIIEVEQPRRIPDFPYPTRREIVATLDALANQTLDYLAGALSETQLNTACTEFFKQIVRIAPQAMPDEPKRPPRPPQPPRSPFASTACDDRDQGIDLDEKNARVRAAFERGYSRAI